MKKQTLFFFFLHIKLFLAAQTHISTNQVWQADTVFVKQNLVVDAGAKLTINPGTVVLFVDGCYMDVFGQLDINGALGDSVIMTAKDTTWFAVGSQRKYFGWGGVFAYNNGVVNAKYALFEKLGTSTQSKNGSSPEGVLQNESTNTMTFEHCRFRLKRDIRQSFDGCSIKGIKSSIKITNCDFSHNKGNGFLIHVSHSTGLIIQNSTFIGNDMPGYIINAEVSAFTKITKCTFDKNKARYLINVITLNGSSEIEQNTFTKNQGGIVIEGIYSIGYFRNNIYTDNGGQIYFWLGNIVITGNVFMSNSYADPYDSFGNDYPAVVRVEGTGLDGVVVNNSFIDNTATAFSMWQVGKISIVNNIFYNNYPTNLNPETKYLEEPWVAFKHNLLQEAAPGQGNIAGDPRLDDGGGFTLAANSPAIDKGNSAYSSYLLSTDVLNNPRSKGQIDIGAAEFRDTYLPMTRINVSDTLIARVGVGKEVARFTTTSSFPLNEITYSLREANAVNNDYFSIEGDKLILKRELSLENILRIKVKAKHMSGAWLEEYYYLKVAPIVGLENEGIGDINVYPIPANQFINVSQVVPGMRYAILSSEGSYVSSGALTEEHINISQLKDGFYIIQLLSPNMVRSFKFYKHQE